MCSVQCYEVMMTWCFVILVPPPCHSMVHTCKLSVEVTWPDTGLWLVNTDHMTWTKVSDRFIPFLDGATPGQSTRILRKLSSDDFISQGSDNSTKPDPPAVMCFLHNMKIKTIIIGIGILILDSLLQNGYETVWTFDPAHAELHLMKTPLWFRLRF